MAGPCSIHQAIGLIFLVFLESGQGASVEFCIFPIGKQRRHATDREDAALVTDFRQKVAQVLEERHIVRNGVAVRQDPAGILQIVMN